MAETSKTGSIAAALGVSAVVAILIAGIPPRASSSTEITRAAESPLPRAAESPLPGAAGVMRPSEEPPSARGAEASRAGPVDDPRVVAFTDAYAVYIDSVTTRADDVVFHIGEAAIHFQDGRMLAARSLAAADSCDPIFYPYPLGPLTQIPPPPEQEEDLPSYCPDLFESLWGSTEQEVRRHGRTVSVLDHRMFVNEFAIGPLRRVESEVRAAAERSLEVRGWLDDSEITYSFISRDIAGSDNRSHHAFGLAVDFVPNSYEGRQVYWRWSRALFPERWYSLSLEERWSPPDAVIEIFERHGFVWGGKWTRFDNIHFEYRPEIIGYARILAGER